MLYIFFGPDSFSQREALNQLKAELDRDGMLESNTVVLDGRQATPQEVMGVCDTAPFLSSQRLVIVEGLLKRFEGGRQRGRGRQREGRASTPPTSGWEALADYAVGMPPSTTLVLVDEEISPANPLLGALRAKAKVRHFPLPKGRQVDDWIWKRAQQVGVSLSSRAGRLLADLVGNNLWVLASELDKLAAYAEGRPVGEEDVRALVSSAREINVFALVDAVAEGPRRVGAALRLLRRLLVQGTNSGQILGMLARQYRLVLLTREMLDAGARRSQIGERLGIASDFVLDKLLDQAERYSVPRLKAAYRRLVEADASIKRGLSGEELALELLLHDLAAGESAATVGL